LTKVRFLLVPGTVVVGFLVNMPIVSQTSTAVTIGSVVIPILRAANLSPVTIGSALLLGCSIGGELLNPGAPELQTTVNETQKVVTRQAATQAASLFGQVAMPMDATPAQTIALLDQTPMRDPRDYDYERCVKNIIPLNFLGLLIGTLVFWYISHRYEKNRPSEESQEPVAEPTFQVNWLKAAVPLLPLAFLYLSSYPFRWLELDPAWVEAPSPDGRPSRVFGTRLIGFAMLLGVFAAALVTPAKAKGTATAFFEGAGYGYANIVSLIVAANCFGQAIREIGIADTIGQLILRYPDALLPGAGILPLAFAVLCGSGMASAQSLFGFFAEPSIQLGIDPTHTGAVVSLASAAGRTMSPVAAVTLMCAKMSGTKPLELSKQVAIPLLISIALIIIVAMIRPPAL
jgi:DcuC family C4-dicarboxylate transporter